MTEDQLFAEWSKLFTTQNRELKDDGEEPLTPDEFFQCRAEDAMLERGRLERLRIARWHDTYNAAVASCSDASARVDRVVSYATRLADATHGELP